MNLRKHIPAEKLLGFIVSIFLLISMLITAVLFWVLKYDTLWKFYSESLRSSLFSGFLTLGGFLLALHTFIIVKLKEEVYETAEYDEFIEPNYQKNSEYQKYGPLRRLSLLLHWAIISCLFASLSQLTFGLVSHWSTLSICICISIYSILLLIVSLIAIRLNMAHWFNFLDEKAKNKKAKHDKSAKIKVGTDS